MSSGPMRTHSFCGRVSATVALPYASSRCACCSSGCSCRKGLLRPPLRKPTLVWASNTRCAVIPAHEVTLLDNTDPLACVTQYELPKVVTILLRLCSTAKQPFSSSVRVKQLRNQSTTQPMSVAACMYDEGASQSTGRKPPCVLCIPSK